MNIPSGVEIMHRFLDEYNKPYAQIQSADGIDLSRDGSDYCYCWMQAFVDMDYEYHYLIEVRTSIGSSSETRDFLYVAQIHGGPDADRYCEWFNQPREAGAGGYEDYFIGGMKWFAEKIIQKKDW